MKVRDLITELAELDLDTEVTIEVPDVADNKSTFLTIDHVDSDHTIVAIVTEPF